MDSRKSDPWRKEQLSQYRSFYIAITNRTEKVLTRTSYGLEYGTWSAFPPETILPDQAIEFGSQSTVMFSGTSGFVHYSVEGFEEPFKFSWENGYFSVPSALGVPPNSLFSISPAEVNPQPPHSEAQWTITQAGRAASKAPGKAPTIEQHKKESPSDAMAKAHSDWQAIIQKAHRSATVHISNKTRYKLERTTHNLRVGGWAVVPPESIQPNSVGLFVAYSTAWLGAVGGTVTYRLSGLEDCCVLTFENPVVGSTTFVGQKKPARGVSIGIDAKGDQAASSKIQFTINTKKIESAKPKNFSGPSFSLLTQNTHLNRTRDGSLPQRLPLLAQSLSVSDHQILCLQGIFHEAARKKLTEELQLHYPHISSEHQNGDGGLMIASTFEILESQFMHFGNGILEDQHTAKGVLGCKLNLGSTALNKVLWVFVTHLQVNPTDQSIQDSNVDKIRKGQLDRCLQLMKDKVRLGAKNTSDVGVILCGDFNITAEIDLDAPEPLESSDPSVQKQKTAQQAPGFSNTFSSSPLDINATLSALESKISKNTILVDSQSEPLDDKRFRCVKDVFTLLKSEQLPLSVLPMLRNALPAPRNKHFVLMAMTWNVIKELAFDHMKALGGSQENAKQVYRDVVLYTLQLLFGSPNLNVERSFYSLDASGADADSEFEGFWKLTHERLIVNYQTVEKECKSDFKLFKEMQLLRYQLFKVFEDEMDVTLTEAAKEKILKMSDDTSPVITIDDFENIEFSPQAKLWSQFLSHVTPESGVLAAVNQIVDRGSLCETQEYKNMKTVLSPGQDVYRKLHPNVVGYTVMNKQANSRKRVDYVFRWATFGDGPKEAKLLNIHCTKADVASFGEIGDVNHFGISAQFNILK